MKKLLPLLSFLLLGQFAEAQTTEDYTVELSATVQEMPPKIILHWKPLTDTPTYYIWKKSKTATSWGTYIATLTASDSSYADAAVIVDSAYEYFVRASGSVYTSTGFIYAGIRCPAIHNRGALVLLVDNTFTDSCAAGLTKLMDDLSGDGWQVIRHDVARTASVPTVKGLITTDYAAVPNVKAVLLVGHVPVPYSGDLNPDAHPDHLGAWPADVYYSSMTASWTDATVNDVSAGYVANRNTPGDGKFDQTSMPGNQLQVSRIDFYDMPAFTATEVQMMNSYLAKDHIYKMDSLGVRHRALISDNFGPFSGEAFAANGWRNFAPLVSRDSVAPMSFISTLATSSYQWAYGCGGGSFTSAGGIGVTGDFAANPNNGIFNILFGSYFGDWNVTNNFLRAPLCASTPALTCCWAGRPNWFFHHMALGENIGYSQRLTQNNTGSMYQPANYGATWVHIALMGDLSLRTDYIQPASNLVVTSSYHAGATINWTASPDAAVVGYYVYRADSVYGYYQRVSGMLTTTSFTDVTGVSGLKYYMVRPVKLTSTPSGRYYNLGIGITDTATVSFPPLDVYNAPSPIRVNLFPNPADNYIVAQIEAGNESAATLQVINAAGMIMNTATRQLNAGNNAFRLDVSNFTPGIYTLILTTGNSRTVTKWTKL